MVGAAQCTLSPPAAATTWIRAQAASKGEWHGWQRRRSAVAAAVPVRGDAPGLRSPKAARLEAALFVADGPLSTRKLAQFALLADAAEVREVIDELNAAYEHDAAAFRIERVASGFQMLTQPSVSFWLDKLHQRQAELKLSPPAMETLTIIAYRQPITRADVEAVRGVQCTEIIKHLMERSLVKIGGEDDSLGRPYLYVTTRRFLELFGLRTLDDLPLSELRRCAQRLDEEPDAEAFTPNDEETELTTDD